MEYVLEMFLVLIDLHSKWIEAFCSSNATSKSVITKLQLAFSQFGVPETIVTDNCTCFVSEEFKYFLMSNGIKHYTSSPYHPASNGLAECAVQIIKCGLRKEMVGDIDERLSKILFNYRITPQTHTADRMEKKQNQQKAQHDTKAKSRVFSVGETVFVKNYGSGRRWLLGTIVQVAGPVSCQVKLEGGRL